MSNILLFPKYEPPAIVQEQSSLLFPYHYAKSLFATSAVALIIYQIWSCYVKHSSARKEYSYRHDLPIRIVRSLHSNILLSAAGLRFVFHRDAL